MTDTTLEKDLFITLKTKLRPLTNVIIADYLKFNRFARMYSNLNYADAYVPMFYDFCILCNVIKITLLPALE